MPIAPDGSPLPYPGDPGGGQQFPETIQVGGGDPVAPTAGGGPEDKIRQIIEMSSQILGADGLDDVEKQFIAQMAVLAQKLLAARQKEKDGLLSGKASPSALRTGLGG